MAGRGAGNDGGSVIDKRERERKREGGKLWEVVKWKCKWKGNVSEEVCDKGALRRKFRAR